MMEKITRSKEEEQNKEAEEEKEKQKLTEIKGNERHALFSVAIESAY